VTSSPGKTAGLEIGERGGIVVDERCRTSTTDILAIGECACYRGRTYGLVGPGYQMARTAVSTLTGEDDRLGVFDMSTKLKLMGVEVGELRRRPRHPARDPRRRDSPTRVSGVYKKLVLSSDRQRLLGGVLVGEASSYGQLLSLTQSKAALPPQPEQLILPRHRGWRGAARSGCAPRCGDHLHLSERRQGPHLQGESVARI
jgi:nitrite reductase (NADH) large subunit